MVLAAGAGTRLQPLTFLAPKPMVPVANRPVLEYTIENLRRHGITEVVLNLHSYPEKIKEHFGDGSAWGMKIQYSYEPELLGTAGGVKKVEAFLNQGTFLVMSGDGLTNVDLTKLIAFHRKSKSIATMGLKAVDSRFDYGVTVAGKNGKIQRFIEKPLWSDVFTNQVNTGVYVFEPAVFDYIPKGKSFDFGKNVWPALLRSRKPIYAYPLKEYWCDIGNLHEYRKAHQDLLAGRVGMSFADKPLRPGIWVGEGTIIEQGVKLDAPCLIGKNCRITAGSHLGPDVVIGDGTHIGRNARIRKSILWNEVRLGDDVQLEGSILGSCAQVTDKLAHYNAEILAPVRQ